MGMNRSQSNAAPRNVGRVLRSSTAGFVVGCRVGQLAAPAFGSLVKAQAEEQNEAIYGLIYNINVDDDPLVRRLVLAENQRENVINDQRRNRLLPIEMSVLALGYSQDGNLYHGLPPRPPLNLDPVVLCEEPVELRQFTDHLGYLRLILRTMYSDVPVDQLLISHIRQLTRLRGEDHEWQARVVNELIELLRSNYDALVPVLEALGEAMQPPVPVAVGDDLFAEFERGV